MFAFKLAAAVVVFLSGLLGGMIAGRLTQDGGRGTVTSLANSFAGGVFLGAALLHMLPDSQAQFASAQLTFDYPVIALIVAGGFFAILLLDKVLVHGAGHGGIGFFEGGAVYPYVLMLTLSVHSVITGIALGLEDKVIAATAIIIAVLAHKSTAAMALGISFNRERVPPSRSRPLLWMFCLMTPIGIVLGAAWAQLMEGPTEALVEGIFDAVASGTFFYIAVVDILTEEFEASGSRWPLFLLALMGFGTMALVAIWT